MEKLLKEIIIEVAIDSHIIYTDKADKDTIDILSKHFNPPKSTQNYQFKFSMT